MKYGLKCSFYYLLLGFCTLYISVDVLLNSSRQEREYKCTKPWRDLICMQSMAIEQRQANWSISGIYDLSTIYYGALIQVSSHCLCLHTAQGYQSYLFCTPNIKNFFWHVDRGHNLVNKAIHLMLHTLSKITISWYISSFIF